MVTVPVLIFNVIVRFRYTKSYFDSPRCCENNGMLRAVANRNCFPVRSSRYLSIGVQSLATRLATSAVRFERVDFRGRQPGRLILPIRGHIARCTDFYSYGSPFSNVRSTRFTGGSRAERLMARAASGCVTAITQASRSRPQHRH